MITFDLKCQIDLFPRPPAETIISFRTWWHPTTSTCAVRTWPSGEHQSTCSPTGTTFWVLSASRWWIALSTCSKTSTLLHGMTAFVYLYGYFEMLWSSCVCHGIRDVTRSWVSNDHRVLRRAFHLCRGRRDFARVGKSSTVRLYHRDRHTQVYAEFIGCSCTF